LVRLRRAVRLRAAGADFAAVALAAGYCDQAHFINECDILPGKKMPRPVWYRVGAHRDETREISPPGSVG